MSGGNLNTSTWAVESLADEIAELGKGLEGYDDTELLKSHFRAAAYYLHIGAIMARRIDYLIGHDDSEESYHKRLSADLSEFEEEWEKQ